MEGFTQRILSFLLVLVLGMLVFIAWKSTDSDYMNLKRQERFQIDYFEETAGTALQSAPIATVAPAETESPAETQDSVSADAVAAVLMFGGDVNLDVRYNALVPEAVADPASCIDSRLISEMQAADVFMAGNLFAITDTAAPANKQYTFRTGTESAVFWSKIGADVLSLANNHSLDYGADGLAHTEAALANEKIATVGAGSTLAEAAEVYYAEVGGKRIAFTAAMRSEKYIKTPEATEEGAGVFKMYTLDRYLENIRAAKQNADFVVAYVHWGTENTLALEQAQIDGAHALIDAGADAVIGSHTHTLQAVELYNGKPIYYSLGDLWCNSIEGQSALAKITLFASGAVHAEVLPCVNTRGRTYPADAAVRETVFARLNQADTVFLDANGVLLAK